MTRKAEISDSAKHEGIDSTLNYMIQNYEVCSMKYVVSNKSRHQYMDTSDLYVEDSLC